MKRKNMIRCAFAAVALAAVAAASYRYMQRDKLTDTAETTDNTPAFNADSAYYFVQKQCEFGPRTMNTAAHDSCGDWIAARFQAYGCTVSEQKADLKGYDGTILKARNIIARFNPEATDRILVCAHWDTRPWADNDPDKANWRKPVMGADDGASGIAVMLELARTLNTHQSPRVGIDFVCFDAEDWGTPQWENRPSDEDSWALGAQYWAANLPKSTTPRYGILLDMVGGRDAKFYLEQASMRYAPEIASKVWSTAAAAGFANYFINEPGAYITDDHIPVNQLAKIPTIDIIPYYNAPGGNVFGPVWHTVNDDIRHISPATLKAVGQTITKVLYAE